MSLAAIRNFFRWRTILHLLFRIGIFFKGLDGLLEILGGTALVIVSRADIVNFVREIFSNDFLDDPNGFFATYLLKAGKHLSANTQWFAAFYLLAHGGIKFWLAIMIWINRLWAFWAAGFILTALAIYQVVRLCRTHSLLLIALTIIDIFIILMLRPEYRRLKAQKKAEQVTGPR